MNIKMQADKLDELVGKLQELDYKCKPPYPYLDSLSAGNLKEGIYNCRIDILTYPHKMNSLKEAIEGYLVAVKESFNEADAQGAK